MSAFAHVAPGSQNDRILRALADGHEHSMASIHRKVGTCRLNSRVAELRARGYDIRCRRQPGKTAGRSYFYQWVDAPPLPEAVLSLLEPIPAENYAPRDQANRYRLYTVSFGEERLVATAADPEALGVALVTLAEEGEFKGCRVGILDTLGQDDKPGRWLANPWEA